MNNEELMKAYRQGYRDGREDAKKEMNYLNFPPVYYGGATQKDLTPSNNGPIYMNPRATVMGTPPMPGYAVNKMETLLGDDC